MRLLADAFLQTARGVRRSPGLLALVVLTLSVGIGGTTAVFSVVDAMLIR